MVSPIVFTTSFSCSTIVTGPLLIRVLLCVRHPPSDRSMTEPFGENHSPYLFIPLEDARKLPSLEATLTLVDDVAFPFLKKPPHRLLLQPASRLTEAFQPHNWLHTPAADEKPVNSTEENVHRR